MSNKNMQTKWYFDGPALVWLPTIITVTQTKKWPCSDFGFNVKIMLESIPAHPTLVYSTRIRYSVNMLKPKIAVKQKNVWICLFNLFM